eukprot:SAG11_NODE_4321_length_1949_cov_1.281622_2_plen_47_part_00
MSWFHASQLIISWFHSSQLMIGNNGLSHTEAQVQMGMVSETEQQSF